MKPVISGIKKLIGKLFLGMLPKTYLEGLLAGANEANRRLAESNRRLVEMQQERIKSEKMLSLGLLAAGVAHEINNPLSGILGNIQLLLEEKYVMENAELKETLDEVEKLTQRTRNIVKSLLSFARNTPFKLSDDSLLETIEEALQLMNYDIIKSKTRVDFDKTSLNKSAKISRQHFQQVVINIVKNSLDELKSQGGNVRIFADVLSSAGVADVEYIRVHFTDDGPGIPERNLSKVFDPFFTTKPQGVGTGLGLAISYGIMQQHNGELMVKNRPEGGVEFIVYLPLEKEMKK